MVVCNNNNINNKKATQDSYSHTIHGEVIMWHQDNTSSNRPTMDKDNHPAWQPLEPTSFVINLRLVVYKNLSSFLIHENKEVFLMIDL